jgi:hypothetical protein
VLDSDLGKASGKDGGHCAGSGVRDRYGMDDPPSSTAAAEPTGDATKTTGGPTGN